MQPTSVTVKFLTLTLLLMVSLVAFELSVQAEPVNTPRAVNPASENGSPLGLPVTGSNPVGATPTPTLIPTMTRVAVIYLTPSAFSETHTNPQVTTDTLTIGNSGNVPLDWVIAEDDTRSNAGGPIVADGSFEAGTPNPVWGEFSLYFGTPLCDGNLICNSNGVAGPRTGTWWARFGGNTKGETGLLTQNVTLPVGPTELSFWLEIPENDANGYLMVRMDGFEVYRATEETTGHEQYNEVLVNLDVYGDGGTHELAFYGATDANSGRTSFLVDDVVITSKAAEPCFAPVAIPWLTVNPTGGTTNSEQTTAVSLTYDSTSLTNGVYTGTLCIDSDSQGNEHVMVPVTLTVDTPTAVGMGTITGGMASVGAAEMAAAALMVLAGGLLVLRRK